MKGCTVSSRIFALAERRPLFTLVFLLVSATVGRIAVGESLTEELRQLLASPRIGRMRVGLEILLLDDPPAIVLEHHSNDLFKPASNQKILTTAAALALLPADFSFRTLLAHRRDDLIVIGSGDPAIGDPVLARAAHEPITALFHEWSAKLLAAGVSRIRGNLVFDDFIFEQEHLNPSWEEQFASQMQNWWVAPVGGLNFNDNCVDVVVKPGRDIGSPGEVTLIPNTPYLRLENTSKTAGRGEPSVRRSGNGTVTVRVSGPVSRAGDPNNPLSLTITDPGMFFASTLRTCLAAKGIAVDGKTRRERVRTETGMIPADLQIIAVHEQDLPDILLRCNKNSQNLFAEALLKALGAYVGTTDAPRVGGYETGRKVIELFLRKLGLSCEGCVIDDGSGLSHSNRVTPAVLASMLLYMDRHSRKKEWLASLAEAGERSGTLKRRMKELRGKVYAKTGHISGVSALSGYVFGPGGRRYAFCILCNDTGRARGLSADSLQDTICRKLATWDGPLTSAARE